MQRDLARIPAILLILALAACGDDEGVGPDPTPSDTVSLDVRVDPTLEPRTASLPGFEEGEERPLAAMTDSAGPPADFVENELILVTDDAAELEAFVDRWNGEVLLSYDPTQYDLEGAPQHLVRVDVGAADASALVADLRSLDENATGEVRVSSAAAERLFAAAASEAVDGATVGFNWIGTGGGAYRDESTGEAPNAAGISSYDPDAYNWAFMKRGSTQDIGVAEAWTMLDWAGRLGNRVKIAVLDGGFADNPDIWPDRTIISNVAFVGADGVMGRRNPGSCGGPCPWHGTNVLSAAMGVPDNAAGAAGPAGPVGDPVIVLTQYGMMRSITALARARRAGARIANMSYGVAVPAVASFTVRPFNIATRIMRRRGMLLFAAAGNDGANVDKKRRVLRFEKKWYAPCENDGVICVGGLSWDSKNRASSSNYGKENVDIYGPYSLYTGGDPGLGGGWQYQAQMAFGTSFASPFVAGVAALIWAADPSLGAGQVQDILFLTAHGSPDDDVERYVNAYGAVLAALGNTPPRIRISSPSEGERISRGIGVVFSATSSDAEDRSPPIVWRSDRDGEIGTGPRVVRDDLSYGAHAISATTSDAGGLTTADSVHIEIVNDAPILEIVNPADGAEFYQGENVALRGTSYDQNRPPEYFLNDTEVHWRSSLAGALGSGHELTTSALNEGTHRIVFAGTDEVGATGADTITLIVNPPPADYPPTATITAPEPGPTGAAVIYAVGDETVDGRTLYYADVLLEGSASDPEDGTLSGSSLVWTTDRTDLQPNPLGTGTSLTVRMYSDGGCGDEHRVTLTATDSSGNSRSTEVRVRIAVLC